MLREGCCDAYTGSGVVCGKPAKRHGLCGRHAAMQHAPHRAADTPPWALRGLPAPWAETAPVELQRIRKLLRSGPLEREWRKAGWLYAYRLERDRRCDMWKVGSTEREPRERLREWRAAHKPHTIAELRVWHAPEAFAWLERLLHRYMSYRRVARYDTGAGELADYWYDTDEALGACDELQRPRRAAMHKHVEWFWVHISEIDALARAATALSWSKTTERDY